NRVGAALEFRYLFARHDRAARGQQFQGAPHALAQGVGQMAGKKIGFVGLGAMGRGLAGNLLRKGYDVAVWDLSPAAVDALVAKGASRAGSVAELARDVDVVCSMVPDAPDVRRVALGEDGIIAGAHPGL